MRFSTRTLLLITTLVAIGVALFQTRPQPELVVDVVIRSVLIDGEPVDSDRLQRVLKREVWHRKLWLMEPGIIIQPCDITPLDMLTDLIDQSQDAGFEKFQFRNVDPGIDMNHPPRLQGL